MYEKLNQMYNYFHEIEQPEIVKTFKVTDQISTWTIVQYNMPLSVYDPYRIRYSGLGMYLSRIVWAYFPELKQRKSKKHCAPKKPGYRLTSDDGNGNLIWTKNY